MEKEAQETKDTSVETIQSAIDASMPVFAGHPAGEGDPDLDPKVSDKEGKPPVKAQEKDENKGEDEWTPKYKSHRDAEDGAKNAERAMHDAKREAKEARDEAAALKKELEETKAAQKAGEATRKEVKEAKDKVDEAETRKTVSKKVADALVKMNKLDTDAPDYYDKVGELWAEAGFGGKGVDIKDIESLVDKKVQELMGQRDAENESQRAAKAGVKKANTVAADAGLDMKEGSKDYRLFWMLAKQADTSLDFDSQVEWAIGEVNKFKEGYSGAQQSREAKTFLEENTPLEKGGGGPPMRKVTDIKPMSLTDALASVERRI